MTRTECFRLLGIPATSSDTEIRKQYKKLALRLHPDVNPDPLAHEVFIKLGKAVEILLNPDYKEEKPEKRESRRAGNESEEERLERMRVAKMRYEQQRKRQASDNNRYFISLTSGIRWSIYKYIMRVSVVLSLAMSTEYFLPLHYEHDKLIGASKSLNSGIIRQNITRIELENNGKYFIQNNAYAWKTTYPEVILETSWFLHTPIKMITSDDFTRYRSTIDFHIGSVRWLLIILFLVPLYPYFEAPENTDLCLFLPVVFLGSGDHCFLLIANPGKNTAFVEFGILVTN